MAAIPGWVYIILGIIMIIASQLINKSTQSNSLSIFLYIGILFILIGVGKYIFKPLFKKKKELKPKHYVHHPQKVHIQKAQNPQHLSIITCPSCATRHYNYANFCMKCGSKIKKY